MISTQTKIMIGIAVAVALAAGTIMAQAQTTRDGLPRRSSVKKMNAATCLQTHLPDEVGNVCESSGTATKAQADRFELKRGYSRVKHGDGTGDTWEPFVRLVQWADVMTLAAFTARDLMFHGDDLPRHYRRVCWQERCVPMESLLTFIATSPDGGAR